MCRSAIFYHDEAQKDAAIAVRDYIQKTKIKNPIVTEIVPFDNWYDAEDYHQKYLVNNPGRHSLVSSQSMQLVSLHA